jgi:enoyl-CoA hydratase/carnithine racemase
LLRLAKPWVALIQGGAIGSGLGIAALADFRVVASTGYFHANFVKLGLHPGFGLSLTLPAIIGDRQAMRMLYFGDRVPAAAAGATGLADVVLGEQEDLLVTGSQFAAQLASRPAAALQAIRRTCRRGLTESDFHAAVAHEHEEQSRLRLPA